MMINQTSAAALYTARSEDAVSSTASAGNDKRPAKQPEEGRTSEFGPAVVTRLSAAALLTARAVSEPGQGADANRTAEATGRGKKAEPAREEQEPSEPGGNRQPASVDLMI